MLGVIVIKVSLSYHNSDTILFTICTYNDMVIYIKFLDPVFGAFGDLERVEVAPIHPMTEHIGLYFGAFCFQKPPYTVHCSKLTWKWIGVPLTIKIVILYTGPSMGFQFIFGGRV